MQTEEPQPHEISAVGGIPSEEAVGAPQIIRHVPWEWLIAGYSRARERLDERLGRGDDEGSFHALFESLNWTASMGDYLEKHGHELAGDGTLRGVRFARNRVHHQWAEAVERREFPTPGVVQAAGRGGLITPPVTAVWYWTPFEALPPAERNDPHGESAYREHLSDEPIRPTLDYIGERFGSVNS